MSYQGKHSGELSLFKSSTFHKNLSDPFTQKQRFFATVYFILKPSNFGSILFGTLPIIAQDVEFSCWPSLGFNYYTLDGPVEKQIVYSPVSCRSTFYFSVFRFDRHRENYYFLKKELSLNFPMSPNFLRLEKNNEYIPKLRNMLTINNNYGDFVALLFERLDRLVAMVLSRWFPNGKGI